MKVSVRSQNTLSLDTSHSIVPSDEGNGIVLNLSEDVVVCNLTRSGSVSWAELAIC